VKRWVAALVAVIFLSTATLHVFAHHDDADGGCTVCQVQASSMTAVSAPHVVSVRTIEFAPAPALVSLLAAESVVDAPARAPPALPA
jgi:hypothetical protein